MDDCGDVAFELQVDERPLGELVVAPGTFIPQRYIDADLPTIPPYPGEIPVEADIRLIAVCKCGEYGCGHAKCRVIYAADHVSFKDFSDSRSSIAPSAEFAFSRANYEGVISSIVRLANLHRDETRNRAI